jgi:dihydropyrimidinase
MHSALHEALDTLVIGGTLHTAERTFAADVGIVGHRIAIVAQPGTLARASAKNIIDATGCDVLPGCIDVHVHLALPFCGTVSCDDFEWGSKAAACGCVTSVLDFAIPGEKQSLRQAHEAWLAKASGKSLIDYAWHLAITRDEHLLEIEKMMELGLPTFKEFMIYESEGWNSDDARMYRTLRTLKQHGGMLLVHAESSRVLDALIAEHHTKELMRKHGAKLHAMTRPNFVEAEAIERAAHWANVTGGMLYVVHMSTAEGADIVRRTRAAGAPVMAETCTQYLTLTDKVFAEHDGHLFACCPQVKKQADIDRLWCGLGSDVLVVSTDTCSFTREQKRMWWQNEDAKQPASGYGDWTKIPMGLPGLDTFVPIMYTLGVKAGRITMNQLVSLCAATPSKIMGLWGRKGDIAPGFDADLAIVNPRESRIVTPANLQSRCDWSPYEGMQLSGFARTTIVRGKVVVDEGKPVETMLGHGSFMMRSKPRLL